MKNFLKNKNLFVGIGAEICVILAMVLGNLLSSDQDTAYLGYILPLTAVLAAYLIFLPQRGIATGFKKPRDRSAVNAMFYLPPALIVVFCYGIYDESLTGGGILCLCAAAALYAVLQESIFRGVIYENMRRSGARLRWCLLVSVLGFCLDAVLFPVANDSLLQLGCRLAVGFGAGLMAAGLYELTESAIPGTAFHALLLISQLLTLETDDLSSTGPAVITLLICLPYAYYLITRKPKMDRPIKGRFMSWLQRQKERRAEKRAGSSSES